MAHVIGFSNKEGVGSAGIELQYDSYLKGKEGHRISKKDARKREIYSERKVDIPPEDGASVILTLDQLNCFQEGCGVHLRKSDGIQDALECLKALDRPWPLTSGIRDESDIKRQRGWPSDAVFISPVRQTSSHLGISALGWNRFSKLARDLGVPAYALGGMTETDIEVVKRYWGFGVAGISGFQ